MFIIHGHTSYELNYSSCLNKGKGYPLIHSFINHCIYNYVYVGEPVVTCIVSLLVSGSSGPGWSPGPDIALCSWARHLTLTVPLSTHGYKCVPATTLKWTSIPSRQGDRNTPSRFMMKKTEKATCTLIKPFTFKMWTQLKGSLHMTVTYTVCN